ncbi:hypothetical protein H5410_036917 [Solanum commersonii]|uniref:Uncharacterized protein n=1 Tax=Solanum commersonii TaxID=4109 RepID=A0A9J5Y696_SOLCO|nr:hypothetical protein H5410_036917 [Solanum commersonii]
MVAPCQDKVWLELGEYLGEEIGNILMVVNRIHGLVQPPWTLKKTQTKLQQMIRDMDCEVMHYFN